MTEQTVLSARTPGDVLTAVPYLLGFRPKLGDVVVVGMSKANRVELVMRADRADVAGEVDQMLAALRKVDAVSVIVVSYGSLQESLFLALPFAGKVSVRDILWCNHLRWGSALCDDPTCCPTEGRPLTAGDEIEAGLVFAGLAPAEDRDAVVDRLQPYPGERIGLTLMHLGVLERGESPSTLACLEAVADARARFAQDDVLDPEDAARVLLALSGRPDYHVRDAVMMDGVPAFWLEVMRLAPVGWLADAAAIVAARAYCDGDGVTAAAALDLAQGDDPKHNLSKLLLTVLTAAVPPGEVERILLNAAATSRRILGLAG